MIPDTQVKPDVLTDQLGWIGSYMVDEFAGDDELTVIQIGDHWDMPSLSSYDKGKKAMEGRRYRADIEAGNAGFSRLCGPLAQYNRTRVERKERQWWPKRHFMRGNHEERVTRACEADAQLDGLLSLDHMNAADHGWQVHDFLSPVYLDGVGYSHYWYQPLSGRPYSGMIENRLKQVGHSFTMGHQQQLLYGVRYVAGRSQHGLVAGACYLHDEDYAGPQGNFHWRGVIVCRNVDKGSYDPEFVSLDALCRRYEGVPLQQFIKERA